MKQIISLAGLTGIVVLCIPLGEAFAERFALYEKYMNRLEDLILKVEGPELKKRLIEVEEKARHYYLKADEYILKALKLPYDTLLEHTTRAWCDRRMGVEAKL